MLYFICGAAHSGTTYLHDFLVSKDIFKGLIAELRLHGSKIPQTNEYKPFLELGVLYTFF